MPGQPRNRFTASLRTFKQSKDFWTGNGRELRLRSIDYADDVVKAKRQIPDERGRGLANLPNPTLERALRLKLDPSEMLFGIFERVDPLAARGDDVALCSMELCYKAFELIFGKFEFREVHRRCYVTSVGHLPAFRRVKGVLLRIFAAEQCRYSGVDVSPCFDGVGTKVAVFVLSWPRFGSARGAGPGAE